MITHKIEVLKQFGFVLFVVICFLSSCNNEDGKIVIEPAAPEPTFVPDQSTFCMPLRISLSDIEKVMDKKIKQDLITDKKLENNYILNARRAGRLRLNGMDNKALISLPLDVSVQKGVKFNFLTVDFKVEIQVLSEIDIDENYTIVSKSEIHKIKWLEKPEINILGLGIDVKTIVEKAVNEKREEIAKTIDSTIRGKVNIEKAINRVWYKMQKPHNIIKKTQDSAFLFIDPISVSYISHSIKEDFIVINLQSTANFKMKGSYSQGSHKRTKIPKLNKITTDCEGFSISLIADLSFNDLNTKINSALQGKSKIIQGYEVEFESAELKPSGQNLFVNLKLKGTYSIEMVGLVKIDIDTAKQNIYGELKKFNLIEGDIEVELASLIFGDFIIDQINELSGLNYAVYLEEIPNLITKGIANGRSGDKWHPEFANMTTQVQNFEISEKGIHLKVKGEGSATIIVDQLKIKSKQKRNN